MYTTEDFGRWRQAGASGYGLRNRPQHRTGGYALRQQTLPTAFTHEGGRLMADKVPDMTLGCEL